MLVSEFELFVQRLINKGLDNLEVTRKTLMSIAKNECELSDSDAYKFVKKVSNSATPTSTRGSYILNLMELSVQRTTKVRKTKKTKVSKTESINSEASPVVQEIETLSFIPPVDKNYVSWGNYKIVEKVIQSKMFYPMFITGLSGNGKTMMVEQVCAKQKREMYRVNITIETDEDDLLGGFRLVNGETVWFDGPVVQAMETGGVLLLDEIDLASNKIMCLQSVLEGKGVFLKKVNRHVKPVHGFTIFATANTKGQGDELGKFVGTGFLNEAFLERFPVTVEQKYPSKSIETKILRRFWKNQKNVIDETAETITENLVMWANITRESFENGAINDLITTRRLISTLQAFFIFDDIESSIRLTINRFDDITKESFLDLYKKITEVEKEEVVENIVVEEGDTKAWFE